MDESGVIQKFRRFEKGVIYGKARKSETFFSILRYHRGCQLSNPHCIRNYFTKESSSVVECLKHSPLVDSLTKVVVVPMSYLSHIYSTAHYEKVTEGIHLDIHNEKTSISKNRFCTLLGLPHEPTMENPDSITTEILRSPTMEWPLTLLFKGLSERSVGSDRASKSFMTILYGLYNGVYLDYGSILWQQFVQRLTSSSRHSEVSCGKFWSIVTKWAMDRFHVPIMADTLISSIATFHTTKIIFNDLSKFSFVGSIPASMYACVTEVSPVIIEYKKLLSSGPRELTPAMIRSIEEAKKLEKRGKKQENQKSNKAAPSQPKEKKTKKPARRLILQSSSDSDSEYLPTGNKQPTPTSFESESSDEEVSVRGDTPPRSPTPEVPVRSPIPSSPPASTPISLPTTFPIITSQPTSTIPIPTPLFSEATKTTTTGVPTNISDTSVRSSVPETTKPLSPTPSTETNTILGDEDMEFDSFYYSPYHVQSDEDDDAPFTKKAHQGAECQTRHSHGLFFISPSLL
ncbi:hypothetical protein Lser_V15G20072 [Lactuca serriola]